MIRLLRDRVDIVELVGRFVTLKRSGRNYKGLCPFHHEKTPSFSVSPERASFYCFGCQEGGNAFTFLMKMENLTFPEAVRALGREQGVEIPETDSGESGLGERLARAVEIAQDCYRRALAVPGNPGAAYLEKRGLDARTLDHFGVGYAPDRWDTVEGALRAGGIPAEIGVRAGLLAERSSGGHYDLLRGRVTFPIGDARGRVIGFGGRALAEGQEPKYLNSRESSIFRKRESLFGLSHALEPMRRNERAVVVEGYFDLIALHRAGIAEAVATCGTALTPEHAHNLRRRTPQVVLLFDGDEAGQRAIERALEVLLPEGLRVRAAMLPPGEDPDSFLEHEGPEVLRELVNKAPPALEFAIRRATRRGCGTPWEKADAVAAVVPLLRLVGSPVERSEFATQLALAAGTESRHVEAAMRADARGRDAREVVPAAPRRQGSEERKIRLLARCLIDHPGLAARVSPRQVAELLPDHPLVSVLEGLCAAAGAAAPLELDSLAEQLPGEAARLLRALAADELALAADAAERAVDDTLRWIAQRASRNRQRELTTRLRDPGADVAGLLGEKQKLRSHPPMEPPS